MVRIQAVMVSDRQFIRVVIALIQLRNKAHKANDASSSWWNDCMIIWLHEIRLVYLLLQLFARK